MKIRNNKNGVALIAACVFLTVLMTLAAGFTMLSVSELNNARRYRDSTAAFWAAEAGINQFIHDTTMLDDTGQITIDIGSYSVDLVKDDSDPDLRVVTATGTANGIQRQVQVEFPAVPPDIYDNTMSSGGNIQMTGLLAILDVRGKTRITGTFSKSGAGTVATFEDKQEGVNQSQTTFKYPDSNNNGTSDEFADFVEFNRDIVSSYPPSEVVYIQSNNTQAIFPNQSLVGKKIIYVEGSTAGAGDVNILFDATWQNNQNLTVITTGKVSYLQPLQWAANSQLNVIAWEGYYEPSVFLSMHTGMTYAHGGAEFREILALSSTTGSIIANTGITATERLASKTFLYDSSLENGNVPPGFEGLISGGGGGYSTTPSAWREI